MEHVLESAVQGDPASVCADLRFAQVEFLYTTDSAA